MAIRFVYFDCMETLIQINSPSFDIYADWAWENGAKVLDLWSNRQSFQNAWHLARERLNADENGYREGTILGRIRDILSARVKETGQSWQPDRIEEKSLFIHEAFWRTYRSHTYVLPEVPECLDRIAARGLSMGIVSNFMVPGGIEELIELHHLDQYFRKVVVSCQVGWRKPSQHIYKTAIGAANAAPSEILFIGDSLDVDYNGARAVGMEGLLYDRKGKHPSIDQRITNILEIDHRLEQMNHRRQISNSSDDV